MQRKISSAARKRLALVAFTSVWLSACGGGGGGGDVTAAAPVPSGVPGVSGNTGASAGGAPAVAPIASGPSAPAAPAAPPTAPSAPSPSAGGIPAAPAPAQAVEWTGTLRVGTTGAGQGGPSLARLANGQTVVAWPTSEAGTQQIKVQRYDDAGAVAGPAVRIDAPSEPVDGYWNSDLQAAAVSAMPTGYVVSWCSFKKRPISNTSGRPQPGWDAFMRRFDLSGAPLGDVIQVNTNPTSNCPRMSVAPLADGKLGVAYRNFVFPFAPGLFPGQCLVRTFDAAGNGSATTYVGDASSCTAAALPDSGFAVVSDRPHILGAVRLFLRRFDASGVPAADEVLIDGALPFPTDAAGVTADQPDVATLPDGNLAITWVRNGSVVAQNFTGAGVATGERFQVAASGASPKVAGLSDGAFALTWSQLPTDTYEVWSQSFLPTGLARDQAVRLATFARAAGIQPANDVTASSNGRSVAGWVEPASGGGSNVFISRR